MSSNDDSKLRERLLKNRPRPPAPRADERERIWRAIRESGRDEAAREQELMAHAPSRFLSRRKYALGLATAVMTAVLALTVALRLGPNGLQIPGAASFLALEGSGGSYEANDELFVEQSMRLDFMENENEDIDVITSLASLGE